MSTDTKVELPDVTATIPAELREELIALAEPALERETFESKGLVTGAIAALRLAEGDDVTLPFTQAHRFGGAVLIGSLGGLLLEGPVSDAYDSLADGVNAAIIELQEQGVSNEDIQAAGEAQEASLES